MGLRLRRKVGVLIMLLMELFRLVLDVTMIHGWETCGPYEDAHLLVLEEADDEAYCGG
jgi:hypothetical protein